MKAHSSRKSNLNRTLKVFFGFLLLLILAMVVPRVFNFVGGVVLSPVHAVNNWFEHSSSVFPSFIRDRKELTDEIKDLENQLAAASGQDLTRERLLQQNNELRTLFNEKDPERTAAAVIARPTDLPYDLLQIDKGTEAGVQVGSPVYIGTDRFIGLIEYTAPDYSFVKLLTSPGFEATAFIQGANVIATIEGYGGGVARVRVPQGIPITIGDLVLLPSIESGVFGRISFVENRPSQPEQYGYISPDIPLQSIHLVAVGTSVLQPKTADDVIKAVNEMIESSLLIEGIQSDLIASSTDTDVSTSTQP